MSRTLILTVDAGGNVPPFLAIARELAVRGHDVEIAGLRPRDHTEIPDDVHLTPLASLEFWDSTRRSSTLRSLVRIVRLASSRRLAREIRSQIVRRHPDGVVIDPLLASAVRASARSGVRTVVVLHAFLSYWAGAYARGPVPALAALCGTHPLRAWREADAVLVASGQELDAAGAASARNAARVRAALPGTEWVGTTEHSWHADTTRDDSEGLILVSLSSTWFPGQADAYRRIAAALGTLPIPAVVTTGGAEIETPLDPPPNVQVRTYAPHAELLPRASLIIGHGGHSTTFRALAHGVPLLVIPMHPLLDQPLVARAVTAVGAGLTLPRTAPTPEIAAAVRTLLDDSTYAAAAARVAQRLRAQDGAAAIADKIETLARATDAHAVPPVPPARRAARRELDSTTRRDVIPPSETRERPGPAKSADPGL